MNAEDDVALDPKQLYRDLLLEHGKHPRNVGPLEGATHEATLHNPLCGDRVTLRLRVTGDTVAEARFEARGCMIACASASLLTEVVAGRSVAQAIDSAAMVRALANGEGAPEDAGAVEPLRGVRDFPARKTCVTLAWDALDRALALGPTGARSD